MAANIDTAVRLVQQAIQQVNIFHSFFHCILHIQGCRLCLIPGTQCLCQLLNKLLLPDQIYFEMIRIRRVLKNISCRVHFEMDRIKVLKFMIIILKFHNTWTRIRNTNL